MRRKFYTRIAFISVLTILAVVVASRAGSPETSSRTSEALRYILGDPDLMDPPVISWAYRLKVLVQGFVAAAALCAAVLSSRVSDTRPPLVAYLLYSLAVSTGALAVLNGGHVIGRNLAALGSWVSLLSILCWYVWYHFAVVPRVRSYDETMSIAAHTSHPAEKASSGER